MTQEVLETLLESKTKVRLLKFLFRHLGQHLSIKDIARRTHESRSAVLGYLQKFEKIGLVKRQRLRLKPEQLQDTSIG